MCGRYSLGRTDTFDWSAFGVAPGGGLVPRWNIAPGTDVLAVREGDGGRETALLRWGLVPGWSRDASIGRRLANARAESAHEKTSFRAAFASRRCMLPADGFYEWQQVPGEKRKQPWRIERAGGGGLALGALWEHWRGPDGVTIESCAILTVPANAALSHIHDRMPVIIATADMPDWLARTADLTTARALCVPAPDGLLATWRISTAVNVPGRDDASVAAPVEP